MKICLIDAGIFIEKPELLKPLEAAGDVQVFDGIPASSKEQEMLRSSLSH